MDLSPAWVVEQLLGVVLDQVRQHPIVWRPGATELFDSFAAAGCSVRTGTASYRALLDAALSQLPEGTFRCRWPATR